MNNSYASTFTQNLDSLRSNSIKFVFLSRARCIATFSILRTGGDGWFVGWIFRNLGEESLVISRYNFAEDS